MVEESARSGGLFGEVGRAGGEEELLFDADIPLFPSHYF